MDKDDGVYIHIYTYKYIMEYYSATKKEWNRAIFDNTDGPREYYVKWN